MPIININSDSVLTDIEHHFRVAAGPGAGKTYWLVQHLKNVLYNSKRLAKTRKIACITYTNIAVETILKRLGTSAERVEVSTIHSFLYKQILKPYASLISSDFGLNIIEMDGHDDIVFSNYGFLNEWKIRTGQTRITEDNKVVTAFKDLRWRFDASGELVPKTDYPHRANGYPIRNDSYLEYKKMTWERGAVHHDDVLFFSYQIIKKFPFVLVVLRAKFPYFFVDEFQDSNPIQIEILKFIAQNEAVVGIIGDKAQSIYGFQGADPSQFHNFNLPGIIDYVMSDNRRSTNEIVALLNQLRTDIVQNPFRNCASVQPMILVGGMSSALIKAKSECRDELIYSLSRTNITSNAMKKEMGGVTLNSKLIEELLESDKPGSGNKYRSKLVIACIKSVEFARENKFKDAIKEMAREFKFKDDPNRSKRVSLKHIATLLSKYDSYKDDSLYHFFTIVKSEIKNEISDLRNGAAKTFYDGHTYQELALCINIPEDMSYHKTVHKAKGDEFDNVLLVLQEENDLDFILNPNLNDISSAGEEQRINYVAVSRAKNRLFISVPTLAANKEMLLGGNFQVVRV